MWESLFYIFLYVIAFVIILLYIVLVYNRQSIIDNWDNYKCNPLVMPFAHYFGKDTMGNLNGCLWTGYKSNFAILIAPFNYMTEIMKKVIGQLFDQLNSIRTILKPIRDFVDSATATVYKKIEGIMNLTYFTFLKMNNLVKRTFSNFRLMLYTLEATQFSIQSTWNGPIGDITRFWARGIGFFQKFMCFAPNTKLVLNNSQSCDIADIKIGDVLFNNNVVKGVMCIAGLDKYFNYNGIIVSGNHIVFDIIQNKWVAVKDAVGAQLVNRPDIQKIYCIITSSNRIHIYGNNRFIYLFADYLEIDDDSIMAYQRDLIYKQLGIKTKSISVDYNLLGGQSKIHMADGSYKFMESINVGDSLYIEPVFKSRENRVVAIIKHSVSDIEIYSRDTLTASISNIIWYNDRWTPIKDLAFEFTKMGKRSGVFYNIVTTAGYFSLEGFIFRDYLELHSESIYKSVREYTLELMNN